HDRDRRAVAKALRRRGAMKSRGRIVCGLGMAMLTGALFAETVVYRDGRILAPIYVAADAPAPEREAAEELARVLEKQSGLRWPVTVAPRPGAPGIYVGAAEARRRRLPALAVAADWLRPKPEEIGPDGFRIVTSE